MESYRNRLKRKLVAIVRGGRRNSIVHKIGAAQGYRLWAPGYDAETAISFLDEKLAHEMLRGLPRTKLLDAGCGTGRRIASIPSAIGIDSSPEMLAVGGIRNVMVGDVRRIPLSSDSFDMVWCRLVLGHVSDPLLAYHEFARVCAPGGYVFVTDFHPEAVTAGHQRTFTDDMGTVYEIEHFVHANHAQLGAQAGLSLVEEQDGVIGPSIRDFYIRGIGLRAYERNVGLKLVAAFLFRKRDLHKASG